MRLHGAARAAVIEAALPREPAAIATPTRLIDSRPRLLLVLLCLALWLPGLFTLPPTDRDESRFAQATKQMLETGDFVRIMNGTEPRNRKPIGIHWLQAPFAAAARAGGLARQNPIWPYRLPSLLGGIAAVLATFSLGLTLFGAVRPAFLAGAMLAACVILTVEAHIAKTDAALLGATSIAIAVLARAWMLRAAPVPLRRAEAALFWGACGVGILIKGPITPMIAAFTGIALGVSTRRWRFLAALRPGWGVPLMLAIVLPWFAAIGLATHGRFFHDAVGGDLGSKLAGGSESHGAPPGLHLLLLPVLCFPATLPVLAGLAAAWARRREDWARFLLCWLLPAWILFEAVPTKLPHYTLPLYPALALLGAAWLARAQPGARLPPLAQALTILIGLALGLAACALPVALGAPAWLGLPALLAALPVTWLAAQARWPQAAIAAVPLYAALLWLELPALAPLWPAPRIVAALRAADALPPHAAGLVSAGYAEPSLMFLAGTDIAWSPTGISAAYALRPHGVALITADNAQRFEQTAAALHKTVRRVGEIDGFNLARGKRLALEIFVADEK